MLRVASRLNDPTPWKTHGGKQNAALLERYAEHAHISGIHFSFFSATKIFEQFIFLTSQQHVQETEENSINTRLHVQLKSHCSSFAQIQARCTVHSSSARTCETPALSETTEHSKIQNPCGIPYAAKSTWRRRLRSAACR